MEKFVFTKKVSLGFIKRSALPGQVVSFSKSYATFQNEKVTDFRDFEILKKYGFLIPFDQASEKLFEKKQDVQQDGFKSKFGIEVKKEEEQMNRIPISKFLKATQIDQDQTFVEQDGVIKQEKDLTVHVAKKNNKQVQIKIQDQKNENAQNNAKSQIKEEKTVRKSSKKVSTQQTPKTTKTAKKSAKEDAKSTVKSTKKKQSNTVRGMKILKSEE